MPRVLHFADAHIDMANYGRHDPQSGLPLRVMDFLKSLDTIVDTAISEQVDLVLFAGDAYKDRTPAPTFQREWGRRIMRLSNAGIPTVLLVGNHDRSPAVGRAHALEDFDTLQVPFVHVVGRPCVLGPDDLHGVGVQILALPWVSRSGVAAALDLSGSAPELIYEQAVDQMIQLVQFWLDERVDPALPVILTAHCSVQGARYGGERSVMLGNDLVLPGSLVKDRRLSYVALGHIHKCQDLNQGERPPVVYPGSIERVDFGEAGDEKYFVIADVRPPGMETTLEWRRLDGIRRFIDCTMRVDDREDVTERAKAVLPPRSELEGAIVRLVIEYPRDSESLIDEAALREHASGCFEFHLVRRPQSEARVRLPEDASIGSLDPLQLLELYWETRHDVDPLERAALQDLAKQVIWENAMIGEPIGEEAPAPDERG